MDFLHVVEFVDGLQAALTNVERLAFQRAHQQMHEGASSGGNEGPAGVAKAASARFHTAIQQLLEEVTDPTHQDPLVY